MLDSHTFVRFLRRTWCAFQTFTSYGALVFAAFVFVVMGCAASPPARAREVVVASAGCGKRTPVAPGTSADETLPVEGLVRQYRLHVPWHYTATAGLPLVLNFHGHGSSAAGQERRSGMSLVADRYGFLVAYPQGTLGADSLTGWNTGPHNYPHVNDVLFVNTLINHLESNFCIDPGRVYATGFSNGGGMTNVLACDLPQRIAAFAIVSGGVHPVIGGCHPTRPVALLDFHGTADHVVPYMGNPVNDDEPPVQLWLAQWAERDGCKNGPLVFFQHDGILGEQWSNCLGGATILHYRIDGGIHQWPTGNFAVPDAPPLNASTLIWHFFQGKTLPATRVV